MIVAFGTDDESVQFIEVSILELLVHNNCGLMIVSIYKGVLNLGVEKYAIVYSIWDR